MYSRGKTYPPCCCCQRRAKSQQYYYGLRWHLQASKCCLLVIIILHLIFAKKKIFFSSLDMVTQTHTPNSINCVPVKHIFVYYHHNNIDDIIYICRKIAAAARVSKFFDPIGDYRQQKNIIISCCIACAAKLYTFGCFLMQAEHPFLCLEHNY